MVLDLPPDPSLKDLQLAFEWRYSNRKYTHRFYSQVYEWLMRFFGEERRPRDIFRSDVMAWREDMEKRGLKPSSIRTRLQVGSAFFGFLNELGVIEEGYNPFKEAGPRRVRVKPHRPL